MTAIIEKHGEIEFDAISHTYRVGGVVVPSVTQILRDLSIMKRLDPELLQEARERGRRVHRAVDLYNRNELDEATVDEVDAPYLRAWKRFCADFRFQFQFGEQWLYSEKWGYAGTPDCVGIVHDRRRKPRTLIDVKTGVLDPVHGPQTAAYLELLREEDLIGRGEQMDRLVVRLQPNGHYQMDRLQDQGDWANFMGALTCYRFRERHGLL